MAAQCINRRETEVLLFISTYVCLRLNKLTKCGAHSSIQPLFVDMIWRYLYKIPLFICF